MTTENPSPRTDTGETDQVAEVSTDPLDDVERTLDSLTELDPADAVEPLSEVTSTLNRELDRAQENP